MQCTRPFRFETAAAHLPMHCLQEDELLLRRIDALLRQAPPPPDEVLQRIVEVLQRARGHQPHSTNWSHVAERVRERPRPQGAMAQAREERERITRRPHSTHGHSALSLPIGESDTARCALPNSTLFYQVPGQVNRTDAASSVLRPPIEGERQRKTRELQVCVHRTCCSHSAAAC